MGEEEQPGKRFRFLTDHEFMALDGRERMAYLVKAGEEELEQRRLDLSVLAQIHVQKSQKGE